ncbi:MAG: universal stress protein [Alphaproteobacteria bacterium]
MTSTSRMRDIHVVIDLGGDQRPVRIATDLAGRYDAHLTGLSFAFQPIIPVYTMAAPVPTDFIVAAHEHAIADAKSAAEEFRKIAQASGVVFDARSLEAMPGDGFVNAVRAFQLSDLVVVGQQNPDRLEPMREGLIEALLFQTGVPMLLIPHSDAGTFKPDRVVIAWDSSATAAQSVRASLPLLSKAEEVYVVTIAEERKHVEPRGTALARYLARHDMRVETSQVDAQARDTGAAILEFANNKDADWIIMGAYGHSRVREFFLGGATRSMLSSTTLPVFMAH